MQARRTLLDADPAEQDFWLEACSQGKDGLILWLNAFGMIEEPRSKIVVGPISGMHRFPWITWPIQDKTLIAIYDAIDQEYDLLIEKSRDMGATIDCLAVFLWFWLFHPNSLFLCSSRKEEFVDKAGEPKALFYKLDFLLEHLPPWMIPQFTRNHLHLRNLNNGSVISGESTNPDMGRGDRRKALLLDEFAAVPDAPAVLAATADTADCRLFNSTPRGAGNYDEFGQLRGNAFAALRHSKRVKVFRLHWSDHPVKGAGKTRIDDPGTGGQKWTSPWYRREEKRRVSRVEIAQEVDIDYAGAGDMFFDADVIAKMRLNKACSEPRRGELSFNVETLEPGRHYKITLGDFTYKDDGILSIWQQPAEDNYAAFADISQGGGASNSCLHVGSVTKRIQVASLLTPFLSPEKFAQYSVAVSMWYGGQTEGAFLGWEANGIGNIFGMEVWRLGYTRVLGNINQSLPWEPTGKNKIGWHSDPDKKLNFLADFRSTLAKGEYVVRDKALIDELEYYVNYENGGVGPSEMVSESSGARTAHGDRVIAGAGVKFCIDRQPEYIHTTERPGQFSMDYFDAIEAEQANSRRGKLWSRV